jgi:hypothetical protein
MDLIEGSETSANINQTLGIHPKIETVNKKCDVSSRTKRVLPDGLHNNIGSNKCLEIKSS